MRHARCAHSPELRAERRRPRRAAPTPAPSPLVTLTKGAVVLNAAHLSAVWRDQLVNNEVSGIVDVGAQKLDDLAVDFGARRRLRSVRANGAHDAFGHPTQVDAQVLSVNGTRKARLASLRMRCQLSALR